MNTLQLRVIADTYAVRNDERGLTEEKLAECAARITRDTLYYAADCIDKLRAHCQRQRKELKRLNASNARIQESRNKRRQEAFLQQLRGDLDRAVEFTKHLRPTNILARVEDLEKSTERVARFVGAVPVNGGAK